MLPALAACASIAAMNDMTSLVERFSTDRASLDRLYQVQDAPSRHERLRVFYTDWQSQVNAMDYAELDAQQAVDWHLLRNRISDGLTDLENEGERRSEAMPLVPYLTDGFALIESRRLRELPEAEEAAQALDELHEQIQEASRQEVNAKPEVVRRAKAMADRFARDLKEWFDHSDGYDPMFSWWSRKPYEQVAQALERHRGQLGEKGRADIPGDPVGRDALMDDLKAAMIPYTPEELIAIGERELAWCNAEMDKAAQEMGADDRDDALERVKNLHMPPGEQPQMVVDLAEEAIDYLEEHDLLTIPSLAKELWRTDMMSPARQKVSPFFLGGETIIISFPTDTMTHDEKLMSMRANNIHFSRAVTHHELIPGHHMQGYMNARHRPYRRAFGTPFWTEGWALYWEFLLYKRGFPATPEDKIGFLYWRRHRAARIIFSLKFHLGQMTADECVEMLVTQVGHEQSTAEGEVRRSFEGSYPPLYQLAYMIGAIQIWSLRQELVESGQMPQKEFHDTILQSGPMPIEMLRFVLKEEKPPRDYSSSWRFDSGSPGS